MLFYFTNCYLLYARLLSKVLETDEVDKMENGEVKIQIQGWSKSEWV